MSTCRTNFKYIMLNNYGTYDNKPYTHHNLRIMEIHAGMGFIIVRDVFHELCFVEDDGKNRVK